MDHELGPLADVGPLPPDTAFLSAEATPLASMTILDYWQWAFSDLSGNTERGQLAEFLVGRTIGAVGETAAGWDAYDLLAPSGARVEVKTSGYLQRWGQRALSRISWSIRKSRAWNDEIGDWTTGPARNSDVYVFCLLHERDPRRFNPLDVSQWTFFVVPTELLNRSHGEAKTIGFSSVKKLASPVPLAGLEQAVRTATSADS